MEIEQNNKFLNNGFDEILNHKFLNLTYIGSSDEIDEEHHQISLRKNNSKATITLKKCELCNGTNKIFVLSCYHKICENCLKCYLKVNIKEKILCPIPLCKFEISSEFLRIIMGKSIKLKVLEMLCSICFDQKPIEDFLTLCCEHKFCKPCLVADWEAKIEQGLINKTQIICPKENCKTPIDYNILKGQLNAVVFGKYDALLLDFTLYNENSKIKEKIITCPNKNCLNQCFIHMNSQYFTCTSCNFVYCANEECRGLWKNHTGLTCQQFKKVRKDLSENDLKFEEYIKEKKLKSCPVCCAVVEKTNNCNYIRCSSNKCQKKTLFCYICGELLNEKTMNSHYINNSSYSPCKNLEENEKVQEENALEIERKKNKEKEVEINNNNNKEIEKHINEENTDIKDKEKKDYEIINNDVCKQQIIVEEDNGEYTCFFHQKKIKK